MSKHRSRAGRSAQRGGIRPGTIAGEAAIANERKTAQLCMQVQEAIATALGSCADPVLNGLWVAEVAPAPDSGRLRVTLVTCFEPQDALARVERIRGFLRSEAASNIHRKRTPELFFHVIGNDD